MPNFHLRHLAFSVALISSLGSLTVPMMAIAVEVPETMTIAQAVVEQIYDNGLQFRTPEAITANATFRACHYLRAMAIWGIYGVKVGF